MKKNSKKNMAADEVKIFIEESDLQWLEHGCRWESNEAKVKDEVKGYGREVATLICKPVINLHEIDIKTLTKTTIFSWFFVFLCKNLSAGRRVAMFIFPLIAISQSRYKRGKFYELWKLWKLWHKKTRI